ncbi:MAG: metallophosphoesterase [Ilumatobacteraceae bacterium]
MLRRAHVNIVIVVVASVSALFVYSPASSQGTNSPAVITPPSISSPSLGSGHSCIVRSETVWCTGDNSVGQLGTGTTVRTIAFSPSLMATAVSVSAGGQRTCAVSTDTSVWCWGLLDIAVDPINAPTFLTKTPTPTPVQMPISQVTSVSVGAHHICARKSDETLWCWGANKYGQLGNGNRAASAIPVRALISKVAQADVGQLHTCAVRTTTSVWCWGRNNFHQLGQQPTSSRPRPTYVPIVRATSVATGEAFTCVVSTSARSQCWGRNNYGQLATPWGPSRARAVTGRRTGITSLDAGAEFVCAQTIASTTWCWGRNRYGQLANGSYIAKPTPQKVRPSSAVGLLGTVATGDTHACGISASNSGMWCWGLNSTGQLGDSSTTLRRSGIAIWPHGVRLEPIGTDQSARIILAGDIACNATRRAAYGIGPAGSQCGEQATASLISSLSPDGVIALGDLQYEAASISDLTNFYGATWGAFKNITYPVRGNHEYVTSGAAGYVEYFSELSASYWTTDAGGWRIIAVDSWCQGQLYTGCSATSAQTTWLVSELQRAQSEGKCAAVMMHHPFVSSGRYATPSARHLWEASVANGADLVMTAHDHHYERFAPLDASGAPAAGGVPLFISGLGGAQVYPLGTAVPGSEYMLNTDHGVVQMTFTPTSFSWGFISAVDNLTYDAGSASCTP